MTNGFPLAPPLFGVSTYMSLLLLNLHFNTLQLTPLSVSSN
jgi:hypothetical protein